MPTQRGQALDDLTGVATTPDVDVSDGETIDLWVNGTFVATVQPEASADGVTFAPIGAALTAPAVVSIPATAKKVRLDCTAFTSGTIESQVGVQDSDRKG